MCPEEKTISTSKQGCEIAVSLLFLKDTETSTRGAEAVTRGIL